MSLAAAVHKSWTKDSLSTLLGSDEGVALVGLEDVSSFGGGPPLVVKSNWESRKIPMRISATRTAKGSIPASAWASTSEIWSVCNICD